MVVYSFYIFDRHAECIYKRCWLPRPSSMSSKSSRPASEITNTANGLPAVLHELPRTSDDDAKLIFGTVFSLRNMVRKLGGEDDSFVTYCTSQYRLHYYETPTNIKFVMLTDVKSPTMRLALQQIYINLYVEYDTSSILILSELLTVLSSDRPASNGAMGGPHAMKTQSLRLTQTIRISPPFSTLASVACRQKARKANASRQA
ncbi:TRAPP subunit bet5 [Aspergillus nanangensis]|uniref:Trafficking protein particle complex subunit n=1 Tax=Aspergillus nanangensis TaxID=2582783 RepID=A0AAD4CD43_ASPNN|nr:TRAPP subunit bet5 [Aspergillus nanangensis]